MAQCITCGTELHPERAQKYNYCMAPECQEKNAKGLTMVAVGMNKAAEELMILDEGTAEDLASGKYRDQRRGSFGTSAPGPGPRTRSPRQRALRRPASRRQSGQAVAETAFTRPGAGSPPVDGAAGKTRSHLQRARAPAGRDSAKARRQPLYGEPDYPRRQEPGEGLTAGGRRTAFRPWPVPGGRRAAFPRHAYRLAGRWPERAPR